MSKPILDWILLEEAKLKIGKYWVAVKQKTEPGYAIYSDHWNGTWDEGTDTIKNCIIYIAEFEYPDPPESKE